MHEADVRVHYAALQIALVKSLMWDASAALHDWAAEWLFDDDADALEQFEQELDIDDEQR